ncbi:zeta toxin family protein [Methylovulum psychrotolerans]|uniref:Toxin n=1 Tax=Methylovulum psychrotolerans TaxID=1704499 RepID=A0A2S5CRL9_9GAMM|nr:zeta toxin family protein [Methylovulum psychrotolerans]MBT9097587.1 zeta toxin family protein [Methylovulum psychrotolerans]POZ53454.1 toxin [Methylovulum psychrotolerans]
MNNIAFHSIPAYRQLKKLRTALAIAQGCVLLSALQREIESTVSQDQAKRVTYLTELFSRIHREIFFDWKDQATVSHRPGNMPDAAKRKLFRETIERLVLDGDDNKDTAIFDNNGFVIQTDNIAERLSVFYQKMRAVRPFTYGNRITLDLFMVALGKLPAFKAVYEQGIDFRRLAKNAPWALHHEDSHLADISQAFRQALDPLRSRCLQNSANGYGKWPENKKFVLGIPFLSHRTPDGIDCLVTVNGGLVPLSSIREELFLPGKQFADYPLSLSERVIDYLPDTEALRPPHATEIDGISIAASGLAPLFCLDVNILSGLRAPGHTELVELIKQCAGEGVTIYNLAHNEILKSELLQAAEGDERLYRGVEIAYERVSRMTQKLENARKRIFEGKTPAAQPKLFMSMGGAGSGKTAVEEIATAQCGANFVIASLDEFRKLSDLYTVLTAASHHSDDYVFVEPFANRLRGVVSQYARALQINLLYDGTGIPYKPRYADIIDSFKTAGFHTQITAVDAFIVKPEGREDELPRSAVISSVKDRFAKTGRALPWVVTVDKHIRAPGSFLAALQHHALAKLSLFANDGERDKHYLVAESFICTDDQVRALHRHQTAGSLAGHLRDIMFYHADSVLKNLANHNPDTIAALISRNPGFDESNVAYQIYHSSHGNRVLVIYNARRMVDFVEKRQLNPNASGEEGLLHKPEALAFHVDPSAQEPWMTRLQD